MAISRAQLAKELEPGLNALFGMEYDRYENQHAEIFTTESSDRAFEEEVMLSGFGAAPTKEAIQETIAPVSEAIEEVKPQLASQASNALKQVEQDKLLGIN